MLQELTTFPLYVIGGRSVSMPNLPAAASSRAPAASRRGVHYSGHRVSDRLLDQDRRQLLVDRIRQHWSEVEIIIRGDNGFCRWNLMRWREKHCVDDIFGIGRNKVLERFVAALMDRVESAFDESGE